MTSINNNQPVSTNYNIFNSSVVQQSQAQTTTTQTGIASNDGFNSTLPTTDPNKKANTFKSLFAKVGNAFGKIADAVGLGTISHYAKQNFQTYDANKSNSVEQNEFSAVSQMIGKSFQEVDKNGNQEISLGEFKKIVGDLVDHEFKTLDTNGDAFLNVTEASAGGYVVGNNSFVANDKDGDQLLSRNEFAGLLNDMKIKNH